MARRRTEGELAYTTRLAFDSSNRRTSMNATSIVRPLLIAAAAACASVALAQTPSTGIDLGSLTPKTPSQKAAADAAGTTSSTGVKSSGLPGSTIGTPATTQTATPGAATKGALSKSGIGVVGIPGPGSAKSTPAATEDTTSPSTDVQVKMPSNFKK
jgi:hypothetical protein